jgi:hypothetical protein
MFKGKFEEFIIISFAASLLTIESISNLHKDTHLDPKYFHQQHIENSKPNFDKTHFTEYKAFPTMSTASGSRENINLNKN